MRGQLSQAESVSDLIFGLLQGSTPAPGQSDTERSLHHDSMKVLVEGISSILAGDNRGGIAVLVDFAHDKQANGSLRWAAMLWLSRAAIGAGNVEIAKEAGWNATNLADGLDMEAKAISLCNLGEIEFLGHDLDRAMELLSGGQQLLKGSDDRQSLAKLMLMEAKVHGAAGRKEQSVALAEQAMQVFPAWADPIIFLARQAMGDDQLERADQLLLSLATQSPRPVEVDREIRLLDMIQQGEVSLEHANAYFRLNQAIPTDKVIAEFSQLLEQAPNFCQVEEALAWKLLKLGKYEEAAKYFRTLSEKDLPPEMHSSVLLGLGCITNSEARNQQPGARLHATVASAPPMKSTKRITSVPVMPPAPKEPAPKEEHVRAGVLDTASGGKVVFAGELRLFSVPDLLEFLRNGRRTGTLVLSTEKGIGAIYLRKGMIISAAAPGCTNLGDILVAEQKITYGQLVSVAESQVSEQSSRLIGALLVERGLADSESIKAALIKQIYSALREVLEWLDGKFSFEPEALDEQHPSEIEVELDAQFVMLNLFKEIDEENRE